MSQRPVYDEASEVNTEPGEVLVDGPDGLAVSMTPEAAEETSQRLLDGAASAAGKRRLKERGVPDE